MEEAIKKAIESLCGRAEESTDAGRAMQFAQAVLNLSHAAATLQNIRMTEGTANG